MNSNKYLDSDTKIKSNEDMANEVIVNFCLKKIII